MIRSVVLLGAGNVAWNLGHFFAKNSVPVAQVYSRSAGSARSLGDALGVPYVHSLPDIIPGADLYLISVKDDAIFEVAEGLPFRDVLVVHTSGSVPLSPLDHFSRSGVLYPLQTFSKDFPVDFQRTPFFVEGSDKEVLKQLTEFARLLSPLVYEADSGRRQWLHVSAVFGCNFVNHLWGIAADILKQQQLPLEVLSPIMEHCLQKALNSGNPHLVQTGPAVRDDALVLEKHLGMLSDQPQWQELYRVISDSIKKSGHDL